MASRAAGKPKERFLSAGAALKADAGLDRVRGNLRQMWHAMWNDVEPVGSNAKGAFHFGCRSLRHHDRRPCDIDKLGQDRPLSRRRSGRATVKGRHHRHVEGPNKVEDVRAVLPAPDAVALYCNYFLIA